ETKRAISIVLAAVIHQYKFASLPELNAVLNLYNVSAERGSEGSSMYRHKGLHYRVLDESGKKVGTPVKASAFYIKPTLTNLEKKFSENETLHIPYKKGLQTTIGWILNKQPASLEEFIQALQKERISTVVRKGKEGTIYGITYVDHKTKCVFNGSDLGKSYSTKAVLENCRQELLLKDGEEIKQQSAQAQNQRGEAKVSEADPIQVNQHTKQQQLGLPEHAIAPPVGGDYLPHQLKKKRKKKRKRLSF
ncbi:MAG TPA: relaxase, partial [Agriterribacter sp.]|nr:relaxase [Agriterribacter sp.]